MPLPVQCLIYHGDGAGSAPLVRTLPDTRLYFCVIPSFLIEGLDVCLRGLPFFSSSYLIYPIREYYLYGPTSTPRI